MNLIDNIRKPLRITLIFVSFFVQNYYSQEKLVLDENLLKYITAHEGYKESPYTDSEGHLTVGIGILLQQNLVKLKIEGRENSEILNALEFNVARRNYLGSMGYDWGKKKAMTENLIFAFSIDQLEKTIADAKTFSDGGWDKMNLARKTVIVDMTYNLGLPKLMKFNSLRQAIISGNWEKASIEIKKSRYFKQVKERGVRNVKNMLNGNLEYKRIKADKKAEDYIDKNSISVIKAHRDFLKSCGKLLEYVEEQLDKERKIKEERSRILKKIAKVNEIITLRYIEARQRAREARRSPPPPPIYFPKPKFNVPLWSESNVQIDIQDAWGPIDLKEFFNDLEIDESTIKNLDLLGYKITDLTHAYITPNDLKSQVIEFMYLSGFINTKIATNQLSVNKIIEFKKYLNNIPYIHRVP